VPFETTIGDRVVRGRMDAVFRDGDDGWIVVDWKTGARPVGAAATAAAVQLAAYRLAWARLHGVPDAELGRVRAAFHYVRTDETIEPTELLSPDQLRELITG
jgi:DNA helicase-2/ATP-dependent DNA helicase PcrA